MTPRKAAARIELDRAGGKTIENHAISDRSALSNPARRRDKFAHRIKRLSGMSVGSPFRLVEPLPQDAFSVTVRKRRHVLANGWVAECWTADDDAKPNKATLSRSPDGELKLDWSKTATRMRLGLPLRLDAAQVPEGERRARLAMRLAPGTSAERAIEWVAIIEVDANKSTRIIARIASGRHFTGNVLKRAVQLPPFDPAKEYRLAVQFQPQARRAALAEIDFTVVPPPASAAARDGAGGRKTALVICWDLAHNCAGRAYLVADLLSEHYDVQLLGALFPRSGTQLWEPLRGVPMRIRTFPGGDMADFLARAKAEVAKLRPDVVIVCKPRLPGLLLGLLAKHSFGCPVILDSDDHELSFVGGGEPMARQDVPPEATDLRVPFGETWTRVAETLVPLFDGVTVSNIALQQRFGGTIIRHARDETQFERARARREELRRQYGYGPTDRVVLFLGTPRAHKGVVELIKGIEAAGDERLVLCIIGVPPGDNWITGLRQSSAARIDVHPPQSWKLLPELMSMADAVCLIQNPASAISSYQIPAKLSDALAAGVPVAVNEVPPFADLPPSAVTRLYADDDLRRFLVDVAEGRISGQDQAGRDYFLQEYSYAANRARLLEVVETAEAAPRVWPDAASDLFDDLSRRFDVALPKGRPTWLRDEMLAPAVLRQRPIDIAYFWKQNDTGIYGRRHDMLLRYLARHDRIGRIVQFDAPVSARQIHSRANPVQGIEDQSNLTVVNTIGRFLRTQDDSRILRRVFVHRGQDPALRLLGHTLPPAEDYPGWVRGTLREAGIAGSAISLVAPIVDDYPLLHDEIGFPVSAADLIDDHRQMVDEAKRDDVAAAYAETLKRVDVVFANCEAQRRGFAAFRPDIQVVPNAGERLAARHQPRAGELADLRGPILGYVGNLRARIDVDLLEELARRRPEWQIVLIGSSHGKPEVLRLRGRPNVHFLGVRRYEEALDYMRMFDVALMPHLDNRLSQSMNPLKLYVYLSVGVPVVSTPVANIEEVAKRIALAPDADGFITAIEDVLSGNGRKPAALPRRLTWEARVDAIVDALVARMNA